VQRKEISVRAKPFFRSIEEVEQAVERRIQQFDISMEDENGVEYRIAGGLSRVEVKIRYGPTKNWDV
jgi:hypothetical protein